jgi:flavin-dependent dehydrogenase
MIQYDVAVIGGGAAGLSATLVLSRARRKVLVVDAGVPRNAPATGMHGYLSRDGLSPGGLLVPNNRLLNADLVEKDVRNAVRDFSQGPNTHLWRLT